MNEIKFGTDGWRAVIADTFTTANVKRVAQATAKWIKQQNNDNPTVVIGYDCRFGGDLFAKTTARVMAYEGVYAYLGEGFSSTPMVSLGVAKYKATAGVVITASHNPPSYNGFKIKAHYGGPAVPSMIDEVEQLVPEKFEGELEELSSYTNRDSVSFVDLESLYVQHAEEHFDMDAIRNSGLRFAFDAMYGAGQNVIKRLLPDADQVHCVFNPSFGHTAPEPIMKNLREFSQRIREQSDIASGLAVDGDADRIGLLNGKGEFVDSHHIILMLVNYLDNHKHEEGKVIHSFSCTSKIKQLCDQFGLPTVVTKVGFKYICDVMLNDSGNTLVGGEESGGIAVTGHIPERDGIWIGLTIWEYMAKTGKTLDDLVQEIYDLVGEFAVERNDLHITEELKQQVMKKCENNEYKAFGDYNVQDVETIDGYKFHLSQSEWVMIRPSGTEPVLRVYAESHSRQAAQAILDATENAIRNS